MGASEFTIFIVSILTVMMLLEKIDDVAGLLVFFGPVVRVVANAAFLLHRDLITYFPCF